MIEPTEHLQWRKAQACGTSTCVEVAQSGGSVFVRDSKDLATTPLEFTRSQWAAFVASATTGSFDF
jgi:Domain of unknown function (DUF397)